MKLSLNGIGLAVADLDHEEWKKGIVDGLPLPQQGSKVDTADLNNYFPPRKLRRVDHFTRMTLLAAVRALHDAEGTVQTDLKTSLPVPQNMGIIISTGYGPSETIFDFLDSMIEFGAGCASPLAFSHSVHNIPAATLSLFLGQDCPYTTICQSRAPLMAGLINAACWINEGRVQSVLLGSVDEKTPLLEENTKRLLKGSSTSATEIPVGEGACFFLLTSATDCQKTKYGTLEFKTVAKDKVSENTTRKNSFAPARSVAGLAKFAVSPRSTINADMPTAAGVELASAALYATKNNSAACIEKNGNSYAVISVNKGQG